MGSQLLALIGRLDAACRAVDDHAQPVEASFLQHPDADIMLSFPGMGVQLGARCSPRPATTAGGSPTPAR